MSAMEGCNSGSSFSEGELVHTLFGSTRKTRNLLSYESTRKIIWKICRHLLRDARRATQRRQFVRRIGAELVQAVSEDAESIGYLYEDMIEGTMALVNSAVNGLITDVKIVQDQLEFTVLPSRGADVKEFCYKVIKLAREVDQYQNIDCVLVSSKVLEEVKRQDFLNLAPELTPYQADKIAQVLLTLPQEVVAQFSQFSSVTVRKRMQNNDSVAIVCLTDAHEYVYLLIAIPLRNLEENRRGQAGGFSEGLQEASLVHLLKDMRDELWGRKQFALFVIPSLLQRDGTLLLLDDLDKQMIEAYKITQFTLELPQDKTKDFEKWIFNINFDTQGDPNGGGRCAMQVKDKMAMWGVVLAGSAAGSLLGFKASPTYGTIAGAVLGGVAGFKLYKALQR